MAKSPVVILYDANGVPLAVQDAAAIPANTKGLLLAGKEGTTARFMKVGSDGAIQSDVQSSALPTGAATEATLATRASESTLGTRASESTLLAIKNTDGVKKITEALPIGDNWLGRIKLGDGSNLLTLLKDGDTIGASTYGFALVAHQSNGEAQHILVEADGTVRVASQPASPPAGTTEFVMAVNESELSVGPGGDVTSPHATIGSLIASGETLALQSITAGAEGDPTEKGSLFEFYWREGTGPTDHLITRLYIAGETVNVPLPNITKARDGTTMIGDGTNNRLVVVRKRLSTTAQGMDFDVRGYVS